MSLGQVNMEVVMYHCLPTFTAFQYWAIEVGTIVSSRVEFVVFYSFVSPSGDGFAFQIVSMTAAK